MSNPVFGKPWTREDDAKLAAVYSAGGIRAAASAFPERTRNGIYHRYYRTQKARVRLPWSTDDDDRLKAMWGAAESIDVIAEAIGRTEIATYWRAGKLGLRDRIPPGWEYLTSAAERAGFTSCQLRRVLKLHGKEVRRAFARPTEPRGKRRRRTHFQIVWADDVDEAVKAFVTKDTIEVAARRAGVSSETLRRRLRAIGVKPPRFHHRWLVTPEQTDRALAMVLVRTPLAGRRGSRCEYVEPEMARKAA